MWISTLRPHLFIWLLQRLSLLTVRVFYIINRRLTAYGKSGNSASLKHAVRNNKTVVDYDTRRVKVPPIKRAANVPPSESVSDPWRGNVIIDYSDVSHADSYADKTLHRRDFPRFFTALPARVHVPYTAARKPAYGTERPLEYNDNTTRV